MLTIANTDSNGAYLRECRERGLKPHPARFPHGLPAFFIKFLTDAGDIVLDPFAGSNVTGEVAEQLQRRWLAFEIVHEYLETSQFRFAGIHESNASVHTETRDMQHTAYRNREEKPISQLALLEQSAEYVVDEEWDDEH